MTITVLHGECLEVMQSIPDTSIDCILCDLPYGTTYASWDSIIDLDKLWERYVAIAKPKAAIILTASQPFTSRLVASRYNLFRYEWIWDKVNGANFSNANRQPLKTHESVLVFSKEPTLYNPQKTTGIPNHKQGQNAKARSCETQRISKRAADDLSGMKFPKSIQTFPKHSSQSKFHSTEKPIALMEYMIRTYTNEGDTVLDNCMGSGATGVACKNLNRNFIGIEKKVEFVALAKQRLGLPIGLFD